MNFLKNRKEFQCGEVTEHANGFKRTLNTLQGEMQPAIPQTRNGGFYPSCLEKGMRSVGYVTSFPQIL